MDKLRILQLEGDVFNKEGPDFVTESICVEMSLKTQIRFHLLRQNLSYGPVEVGQDFHCELGVDATLHYEVVEGIGKRDTNTAASVELVISVVIHCYGAFREKIRSDGYSPVRPVERL